MAKAKFTYDESGSTFFYFVLSFLTLILVPTTYYFWPKDGQDDDIKLDCRCTGCQSKRQRLKNPTFWKRFRSNSIRALIIFGWIVFALVAYKCATIKHEYVNWDPYEILGVSENAGVNEIKKAYRKLSLIYHPDKETGDNEKFVKITKAYAALTDDDARQNWEMYGNPDGPGATSFGIALPSWIVEKENAYVVLGIYGLVMMVVLPVSVGFWWHGSEKFGCDKVLIATSELYFYYIHKTPSMAVKRALMIIASSLEFCSKYNSAVVERESDNIEVPRLIREINLFSKDNKERPFFFPYSLKARAILQAHLSRYKLPPTTLESDRRFLVSKCPNLIHEFVNCTAQLTTLALSGRVKNMPTLLTLENAMKLCPMLVQALWEYQSPLLQLPYFTEDSLRHMERRKIKVRSLEQLSRITEAERRAALKNFTDNQYDDIRHVLSKMPLVKIEAKYEVLDDEDPNIITASSIVTVNIKLTRSTMQKLMDKSQVVNSHEEQQILDEDVDGDLPDDIEVIESEDNNNNNDCDVEEDQKNPEEEDEDDEEKENHNQSQKKSPAQKQKQKQSPKQADPAEDGSSDDEWDRKFQEKVLKKQKVFESKPRKSHSVHCPMFPEDKQEFWWLYVVDRKRFRLVTAPALVTSLVETEDIELKFTAPPKAGLYTYTVVCRSDSYIDAVIQSASRVEVRPAKEYHEPVYDIPDDEIEEDLEDENSAVTDSDLMTDTDED